MVRLQDVLRRDGKCGGANRPNARQADDGQIGDAQASTGAGGSDRNASNRTEGTATRGAFRRAPAKPDPRSISAEARRAASAAHTRFAETFASDEERARSPFAKKVSDARLHFTGTSQYVVRGFRNARLKIRTVAVMKSRVVKARLSNALTHCRTRIRAGWRNWRHQRAHFGRFDVINRSIAAERARIEAAAADASASVPARAPTPQSARRGRLVRTLRGSARSAPVRAASTIDDPAELFRQMQAHAESQSRRSDEVRARLKSAGFRVRVSRGLRVFGMRIFTGIGGFMGWAAGCVFSAWSALGRRSRGLIPSREVIYRSRGKVSHHRMSPTVQVGGAIASVAVVMWAGFASYYYVSFDHMIQQRDREIASLKSAYRSMASMQEQTRGEMERVTAELETTYQRIVEVIDRAGIPARAKVGPVGAVSVKLAEVPASAPNAFKRDMYRMRKNWGALSQRTADLGSAFVVAGAQFETVVSAHGAVSSHRDGLIQRVAELQTEMANLRTTQEEVLARVTERTRSNIVEVAQVIEKTGLDAKGLLARLQKERRKASRKLRFARGGPFIELASAKLPSGDPLVTRVAKLDKDMGQWQDFQQILRMLPISTPVDVFTPTSGFGKRRDPIRRRWSMHSGFDMANKIGTPILASAPGKVTFAGWRGGNGRMIEVDHGLGITTRYLHLSEILVEEGDQVGFRDKIGLMGSSGRSTGSHLHYEIRIEGRAVNPRRFLQAGKFVFVGK